MTDVVELARMRRKVIRTEIEALDRFVGTAERLLRSVRKPVQIAATVEPKEPAQIDALTPGKATMPGAGPATSGQDPLRRPQVQSAAPPRSSEVLPSDWTRDTFDFEQMATGAA